MMLIVVSVAVAGIILLYFISPLFTPKPLKLKGAHVMVTGGSSGIGKAVAAEAAKRGAHVTLLARDQKRLGAAKRHVETFMNHGNQIVTCISIDLVKDYSAVEKIIRQAMKIVGPVSVLVNCAGYAVVGRFEETAVEDFKKQIDANYLSSVHATRSVIAGMKQQNSGRIVFTSSQAGQLGVFGYTAYSASKFALRGFAEALQMEVKPYNIRVTLAFPPDTDTPGYARENIGKPPETKQISEAAGLFQPDYVATCILDDAVKGKFLSSIGVDGWMIGHLTSGMCPATTLGEVIQQITLMGLFRAISLFYLSHFDGIVQKCKAEREKLPPTVQASSGDSS